MSYAFKSVWIAKPWTWTWVAFCAFLRFPAWSRSIKGEDFPVATFLQINFVSNSSFLIRLYSFDLSGLRLGMAYVKQMILSPIGELYFISEIFRGIIPRIWEFEIEAKQSHFQGANSIMQFQFEPESAMFGEMFGADIYNSIWHPQPNLKSQMIF